MMVVAGMAVVVDSDHGSLVITFIVQAEDQLGTGV